MKVKNPQYVALHRLKNNTGITEENMIRLILGEINDNLKELLHDKEITAYFPDIEANYIRLKNTIHTEFKNLENTWEACKDIKDQKDFALAVIPITKYNSVLFNLRKQRNSEGISLWDEFKKYLLKKGSL